MTDEAEDWAEKMRLDMAAAYQVPYRLLFGHPNETSENEVMWQQKSAGEILLDINRALEHARDYAFTPTHFFVGCYGYGYISRLHKGPIRGLTEEGRKGWKAADHSMRMRRKNKLPR